MQLTLTFSSLVIRLFKGKRYAFSLWLTVAITSHRKCLMKAVRAPLCAESGVAVRKNKGNFLRSLKVGDVEPKETSEVKY